MCWRLLDALGLDRVLLVGHDWGGYVGYRMVLGEPRRFDGEPALNMAHPWVTQGSRLRQTGGATLSSRAQLETPTGPSCFVRYPRRQ